MASACIWSAIAPSVALAVVAIVSGLFWLVNGAHISLTARVAARLLHFGFSGRATISRPLRAKFPPFSRPTTFLRSCHLRTPQRTKDLQVSRLSPCKAAFSKEIWMQIAAARLRSATAAGGQESGREPVDSKQNVISMLIVGSNIDIQARLCRDRAKLTGNGPVLAKMKEVVI